MSQKRKLEEFTNDAQEHILSHKKHKGNFKPRNASQSSKFPNSKTNTTNSLKTRIRDLRRLLEHAEHDGTKYRMPANVRIERERELATCEHELAEKTASAREAAQRKKMIGKYHQVRFFDRQRATRNLKKIRREVDANNDPTQVTALRQKLHNAEVDLNYSMYYPLAKAYSALFPRTKGDRAKLERSGGEGEEQGQPGESIDGPKGDPNMWRTVEKAMKEDSLEVLRNSKVTETADAPPQASSRKKVKPKSFSSGIMRKMVDERKRVMEEEEAEESDGGFFE